MSQVVDNKGFVVITGASSGIGEECVRWFAREGLNILALARRVDQMKEKLDKLSNVLCLECDVTNFDELQQCITKAEKQFGPVMCLVNNAGIMYLGHIENQDINEWNTMIDTNVKGYLNAIKCVVPTMKQNKKGIIINVSSIAGQKYFDYHTVYCSTKHAIQGITEGIRQELLEYNIKVISIMPGCVKTELIYHTNDEKIKAKYLAWRETMDKGALVPEDIARCVLFAYQQPARCNIRELHVTPLGQDD